MTQTLLHALSLFTHTRKHSFLPYPLPLSRDASERACRLIRVRDSLHLGFLQEWNSFSECEYALQLSQHAGSADSPNQWAENLIKMFCCVSNH
jgi:hypothetical protein